MTEYKRIDYQEPADGNNGTNQYTRRHLNHACWRRAAYVNVDKIKRRKLQTDSQKDGREMK